MLTPSRAHAFLVLTNSTIPSSTAKRASNAARSSLGRGVALVGVVTVVPGMLGGQAPTPWPLIRNPTIASMLELASPIRQERGRWVGPVWELMGEAACFAARGIFAIPLNSWGVTLPLRFEGMFSRFLWVPPVGTKKHKFGTPSPLSFRLGPRQEGVL